MLDTGSTETSDPPLMYSGRSSDYEHDRLQYSSPEVKEYAQELRKIQEEHYRSGRYYKEQHQSFGQDGGATTDQSSPRGPPQQSGPPQNPPSQAQTSTDPPVRRVSFRWYCAACNQGPYSSLMPKCIEPSCQRPFNDDCHREQIIYSNPMVP